MDHARILNRSSADSERLGGRLEDEELLLGIALDCNLGLSSDKVGSASHEGRMG